MSSFKLLQRKDRSASSPAIQAPALSRVAHAQGRGLAPAPRQLSPVTQAQLDHAARFGHSIERIALFSPTNEAIQQTAVEGTRAPSGTLPFAQRIQQSFGRHTIDRVQAHVGPRATASATAIHASAYTTGNHVVFAGRPTLHTVAHEAAHVVQQRAGVQLAGGIDRDGDPYEQHADAVADRVTAGQSAEDLLDRFAARQQETHSTPHMPPTGQVQRTKSKQSTIWGTFDAEYYEALKTEKSEHKVGAAIVLTFTPDPLFLAGPGRIGLVQTVRENEGEGMRVDTKVKQQVLNENQKEPTWREEVVTESPVYGALRDLSQPLKPAPKSLADTPDPRETAFKVKTPAHKSVSEETVEKSGAYKYKGGVVNPSVPMPRLQTGESFGENEKKPPVPAALTDVPGFAADSDAAKQAWKWKAEVVAVMLSGKYEGLNLGSIGWGWEYKPPEQSNTLKSAELNPEEIELISRSSMSPEFMKAAFNWNTQSLTNPQGGQKVDVIEFPLPVDITQELARAHAEEWSKLKPQQLWSKTEDLLSVHEKSLSRTLSYTERKLLDALDKMFASRADKLDTYIKQAQMKIEVAREADMTASKAEEELKWFTEMKSTEAAFRTRIKEIMKYQTA